MVAVVDDDGEPPADLKLAWLCGENHLPDSGGVFDQDYAVVMRMRAVFNVWRTLSRMRNLVGEQIHSLTDGERKLLRRLVNDGLLFTPSEGA